MKIRAALLALVLSTAAYAQMDYPQNKKNVLSNYAFLKYYKINCPGLTVDLPRFEREGLRANGIDLLRDQTAIFWLNALSADPPALYGRGNRNACKDALDWYGPNGVTVKGMVH